MGAICNTHLFHRSRVSLKPFQMFRKAFFLVVSASVLLHNFLRMRADLLRSAGVLANQWTFVLNKIGDPLSTPSFLISVCLI